MTRADIIPAARDEDTRLIERQERELAATRRKLADVTTDRDELLRILARIAVAVGMPDGIEPDKLLRRIEELA